MRHRIKTDPRQKPERFRPEIARERGFETIQLLEEMVAEFEYQPVACKKSYRMIVVRKRVGVDKGQMRLFEEYRYLFYITNDREMTAEEVVFSASDRCDQEKLIAQLKGAVRALTAPVDDLVSNWEEASGAGLASTPGETQGRETKAIEDGIRDVLCGIHSDAMSNCAGRTAINLPVAILEPMARGFPPTGRADARVLAMLNGWLLEVGVRMPRSV